MEEDEEGEADGERRGSIPFIATRRGSKLTDLLKYNQEKKRKGRGNRYKDKQGFVWRKMEHDEDLPIPRTPQPQLPRLPQLQPQPRSQQQPQDSQPPHNHSSKMKNIGKIPSIDVECLEAEEVLSSDSRNLPRDGSLPPDLFPRPPRDPDAVSLHSLRSENSFKTCSSEPQLNLVPRQVADTYEDRAPMPHERKSSMRLSKNEVLVQQHHLLQRQQQQLLNQQQPSSSNSSTVNNNGSATAPPRQNQNKSTR